MGAVMARERSDDPGRAGGSGLLRRVVAAAGWFTDAGGTVPWLAGVLLALAGVLLAAGLPVAVVRIGLPLGPLLLWLSWMALLCAAGAAVLALRRSRQLDQALRRERDRFRTLAEVVPAGICHFDRSGALVFSNAMCERLFGGVPHTCGGPCGGGSVFRCLAPAQHAGLRERWDAARHHSRPFAEDLTLTAEGGERLVSLTAVPVADGGHLGYVCCLTERAVTPAEPPSRTA